MFLLFLFLASDIFSFANLPFHSYIMIHYTFDDSFNHCDLRVSPLHFSTFPIDEAKKENQKRVESLRISSDDYFFLSFNTRSETGFLLGTVYRRPLGMEGSYAVC